MLLAILSPSYIDSQWCTEERDTFLQFARESEEFEIRDRLFKVIKNFISHESHPEEINSSTGYEFFQKDPVFDKAREFFRGFGAIIEPEFWDKINDLADDICAAKKRITAILQEQAQVEPTAIVYLAETTPDRQDDHDQIRRELLAQGCTIVTTKVVSKIQKEVVAAIRSEIRKAHFSIHLIGNEDFTESEADLWELIETQYQVAGEIPGKLDSFSRLTWVPLGLKIDDNKSSKFINSIRTESVERPTDQFSGNVL